MIRPCQLCGGPCAGRQLSRMQPVRALWIRGRSMPHIPGLPVTGRPCDVPWVFLTSRAFREVPYTCSEPKLAKSVRNLDLGGLLAASHLNVTTIVAVGSKNCLGLTCSCYHHVGFSAGAFGLMGLMRNGFCSAGHAGTHSAPRMFTADELQACLITGSPIPSSLHHGNDVPLKRSMYEERHHLATTFHVEGWKAPS